MSGVEKVRELATTARAAQFNQLVVSSLRGEIHWATIKYAACLAYGTYLRGLITGGAGWTIIAEHYDGSTEVTRSDEVADAIAAWKETYLPPDK